MAQTFSEQVATMDLNTKRLKKMNEEINKVTNDLKILNRLTKIESYGLQRERDSSADIALKHIKSSPMMDMARHRSGINLNFKNVSRADYSQSLDHGEKLPHIQPKRNTEHGGLYSKDINPSIRLQTYLSQGSRDSQFYGELYGRDPSPKPSEKEAYLSKEYRVNYQSKTNNYLHSHKPSESKFENNLNSEGSTPLKKNALYDSRPFPVYSTKNTKSEFSPFESAKVLKQKILSKDAVLTNSIMMQQKSQHMLNKSIRASHQAIPQRLNSDSAYTVDEAFKKNYLREPQTASTGVYSNSNAGNFNKIDPLPKEIEKQGTIDFTMNYGSPVNRFLPSVGKNGFSSSKDDQDRTRKLTELQKLKESDLDSIQEKILKRKNTNHFVNMGTAPTQSIPKRSITDSASLNNWVKLDWSIPSTEKLDTFSEFRLEKVLGRGNSSTVHRAVDLKLNMPVAVKILEKSSVKETYLRDMLQKEIDISSKLNHPNIAKLYRVLQDGTKVYLVQEYCGSQTLSHYADHKRISDNKAKSIFKQVSTAVAYMHAQGFAHRDLKFSNILINDLGIVKLVDFGFACEANKKQRIFCGTPSYMPPELIKKKEYLPSQVDAWSLGVVLYKLVTNSYPFGACNDKDLEHKIDSLKYSFPAAIKPEVKTLIELLLCHTPTERIKVEAILQHPWIRS